MLCRLVLIVTVLISVGTTNGLNAENEARLKKFMKSLQEADASSPQGARLETQPMKVFRTFRCLRPLRAMSRLEGLKVGDLRWWA